MILAQPSHDFYLLTWFFELLIYSFAARRGCVGLLNCVIHAFAPMTEDWLTIDIPCVRCILPR